MTGDASDAAFGAEAAQGATAVYHCMNPPYLAKVWAELVPRFMENLILPRRGGRARRPGHGRRFELRPTDADEGARATVAWAQEHHPAPRRD